MITRVLTSVIGIPLAIALIGWGSPIVDIAGVIIGLIGIYEFFRVTQNLYKPIVSLGYIGVIVYLLGIQWAYPHFVWYAVGFLMMLLIVMVFTYPKYTIVDVAITYIGTMYVAVLLGFILLVRQMPMGEFYVWFIFLASWGSDTCAYFAGRFFGKHKLAPLLSPKKTVEGAIGGAIGAGGLALIYVLVYGMFDVRVQAVSKVGLAGIVIIAAILSQIGDLAASGIKRYFEAKDYGTLFPGHGGVLDRFDSVLFVAPALYLLLQLSSIAW